jgi:hypothetical protein
MGQFSAEKPVAPGSALSGNQHRGFPSRSKGRATRPYNGPAQAARQLRPKRACLWCSRPCAAFSADRPAMRNGFTPASFRSLVNHSFNLKSGKRNDGVVFRPEANSGVLQWVEGGRTSGKSGRSALGSKTGQPIEV